MNRGAPHLSAPDAPDRIRTRSELAQQLTVLRWRSGLTVRELARRLDTPSATVGDYVSGRHLPGPAQLRLFCELLRACGVEEAHLPAWIDAVARLRASSDGRVGKAASAHSGPPQLDTEDAELFVDRETAIADALTRLRRLCDRAGSGSIGLSVVVGPARSGRSSRLRSGAEATVRADALDTDEESWTTAVIAPGTPAPLDLGESIGLLPDSPSAQAGWAARVQVAPLDRSGR
jgi:transcriptional regulator with XRE-family HTH domain